MSERKPMPGDKDYKGGVFKTRVYSDGKNVEVTTTKDAEGNILNVSIKKLIMGIF